MRIDINSIVKSARVLAKNAAKGIAKNKLYIKLIAVYFIYSLSVLFSKIAGVQDNNISFIVFYFIDLIY